VEGFFFSRLAASSSIPGAITFQTQAWKQFAWIIYGKRCVIGEFAIFKYWVGVEVITLFWVVIIIII
jgi:hypothetical protein